MRIRPQIFNHTFWVMFFRYITLLLYDILMLLSIKIHTCVIPFETFWIPQMAYFSSPTSRCASVKKCNRCSPGWGSGDFLHGKLGMNLNNGQICWRFINSWSPFGVGNGMQWCWQRFNKLMKPRFFFHSDLFCVRKFFFFFFGKRQAANAEFGASMIFQQLGEKIQFVDSSWFETRRRIREKSYQVRSFGTMKRCLHGR